jgi:hypothetical protein
MTQQEFTDKFKSSDLGEVWAWVQNYLAQETEAPAIKQAEAEAALAEKLVAIQKADEALKSGDAQAAAEALAAINETKLTDEQRQIQEIDRMIAELQAKKAEITKP